jgi:hypothetical protein
VEHPNAGPTIPPRHHLLDLAVVQSDGGRRTVFREQLGEPAAGRQGLVENAAHQVRIEHGRPF